MDDIHLPFVSVIMPVKNEERYIERSLGAVLAQDYPADRFEVLVVDGNSSDRTRELIGGLAARAKFPVEVLDNPTGIVPKALNTGLGRARGEIVIRVDGHCEVPVHYARSCVAYLLNENVDCVGGTINTVGETYVARAIAICMSSRFGVGNVGFRVIKQKTMLTDSVPFPAYRREIFQKVGFFDEEMLCNEDDEFNYRLLKNGGCILLSRDLRTRYYSRGSLGSLWKQYYKYGLWKVRIMQKHPKQMRLRQFVPSVFVIALVLSVIIAALVPNGWIPPALLAGLYALFILAGSVRESFSRGLKYFPLLPVIFAVLHISYGAGFLNGLLRFREQSFILFGNRRALAGQEERGK